MLISGATNTIGLSSCGCCSTCQWAHEQGTVLPINHTTPTSLVPAGTLQTNPMPHAASVLMHHQCSCEHSAPMHVVYASASPTRPLLPEGGERTADTGHIHAALTWVGRLMLMVLL